MLGVCRGSKNEQIKTLAFGLLGSRHVDHQELRDAAERFGCSDAGFNELQTIRQGLAMQRAEQLANQQPGYSCNQWYEWLDTHDFSKEIWMRLLLSGNESLRLMRCGWMWALRSQRSVGLGRRSSCRAMEKFNWRFSLLSGRFAS